MSSDMQPSHVSHDESPWCDDLVSSLDLSSLRRRHPDRTTSLCEWNRNCAPIYFRWSRRRGSNRTLAGIAGSRKPRRYEEIYAHVKAALVDDAWATIGSTNIANRSFYRDSELNASFWHQETVHTLRVELLQEHLGLDTAGVDDRGALQLYRDVAHANRARRASGEPMSGLAYAIDPAEYVK